MSSALFSFSISDSERSASPFSPLDLLLSPSVNVSSKPLSLSILSGASLLFPGWSFFSSVTFRILLATPSFSSSGWLSESPVSMTFPSSSLLTILLPLTFGFILVAIMYSNFTPLSSSVSSSCATLLSSTISYSFAFSDFLPLSMDSSSSLVTTSVRPSACLTTTYWASSSSSVTSPSSGVPGLLGLGTRIFTGGGVIS